jgi:hypothetical protein
MNGRRVPREATAVRSRRPNSSHGRDFSSHPLMNAEIVRVEVKSADAVTCNIMYLSLVLTRQSRLCINPCVKVEVWFARGAN